MQASQGGGLSGTFGGNAASSEANIKRCSRCLSARYCSVTCQKRHYPYHAQYCSAIADVNKNLLNKVVPNINIED